MAWQAMVAAAIAKELGGIAGALGAVQQHRLPGSLPGSSPPQGGGVSVPNLYGQDPFTQYLYGLGEAQNEGLEDDDLEERRREILRALSDRLYGGE